MKIIVFILLYLFISFKASACNCEIQFDYMDHRENAYNMSSLVAIGKVNQRTDTLVEFYVVESFKNDYPISWSKNTIRIGTKGGCNAYFEIGTYALLYLRHEYDDVYKSNQCLPNIYYSDFGLDPYKILPPPVEDTSIMPYVLEKNLNSVDEKIRLIETLNWLRSKRTSKESQHLIKINEGINNNIFLVLLVGCLGVILQFWRFVKK